MSRNHHRVAYVALVETHDTIVAVADTAGDAVTFASRKALSYLRSQGAVTSLTNTPEKIADYFGVHATEVPMNTAVFLNG